MLGSTDTEFEMTIDEFNMIRDFIHEKSGIYFAENKIYLVKNRLSKRMSELNMKSIRDYFYHVKYDVSLKEFNCLMNLITTNETSFFRNEPQLLSFSKEVLPLIISEKMKVKGKHHLRIWSAGCSTGEEPYTLAMIILDTLPTIVDWQIEIIANDISEDVLKKARKGEYSGITLRNMNPAALAKHFDKRDEKYIIKPNIKNLVKFSHMNLNDPCKASMVRGVDAIFCRNVMIYFSEEIKKQLVRGFFNALNPGGYFYIGHSETLHGISKAFKLVYFKNALVYQKEAVASKTATGSSLKTTTNTITRIPSSSKKVNNNAADGAKRAIDLLNKIKPVAAGK